MLRACDMHITGHMVWQYCTRESRQRTPSPILEEQGQSFCCVYIPTRIRSSTHIHFGVTAAFSCIVGAGGMDMQLEETPLAFFRAKSVRSLWLLIACVYVNACMQHSIYLDRCSLPVYYIFNPERRCVLHRSILGIHTRHIVSILQVPNWIATTLLNSVVLLEQC